MPSGKVHGGFTIGASVVIAAVGISYGVPTSELIICTAGCMTGLILSPDMDVDNGFLGNFIVDRLVGVVIGWVWKLVWKPYAFFIPHRSPWSHWPIFSTALRLAYCFLLEFLLSKALNFPYYFPKWDILWIFYLGLATSDTLHWLADILTTATRSIKIWTTPSGVRSVRRSSSSRTASPSLTQRSTRDVVESLFTLLARRT